MCSNTLGSHRIEPTNTRHHHRTHNRRLEDGHLEIYRQDKDTQSGELRERDPFINLHDRRLQAVDVDPKDSQQL